MGDRQYSSFLFARPTFISGLGRALDLGSTMTEYNRALDGQMADAIAMRMDWSAVAADFRTAYHQFKAMNGNAKKKR